MRNALLHLVFFLSGFAALGFQLMWTRIFALGIGHELGSVLAIVTAFFGGLALGAWFLDKPIARSLRPGRVYAGLEAVIALWGAVSLVAIPLANKLIYRLAGLDSPDIWRWAICFLVPFATLLPATFCMGGTLPAMERAVTMISGGGKAVPGLYAANTLGAVLGTFSAVFVFSPRLGYRGSILVLAALALICSVSVFFLVRRQGAVAERLKGENPVGASGNTVLVPLFFTGLLGIGYEVVVTRALSQFFEDSVYTYASLLMVYLLGASLGAFAYRHWISRRGIEVTASILIAGLGIACLIGTALVPAAGAVHAAVANALEAGFRVVPAGGHMTHFIGEMAGAAAVFLLPTFAMGAVFSHLAQGARETSIGLGRALAVNTLGGAIAPFLFGIVSLPALGIRATLIALGLAYFLLIKPSRVMAYAAMAALIPLAVALGVPWNLVTVPAGSKLISYAEGSMASVAVLENEEGGRSLKIDNLFYMGGTQTPTTERMKAHLPLLLHPHPETALFIGLGTGVTFGTVADYPGLSADAVELDPQILEMLPYFAPANHFPYGGAYRIYHADARRFFRSTPSAYDVVVADFFHPNRDGAAALYTVEHFRAVKSRLSADALFCQWLPLYQLDTLSLRIIVKTFMEVFPDAKGFLGSFSVEMPGLALVGSGAEMRYSGDWFEKRVGHGELRETLAKEAINDGYRTASFYFASRDDLKGLAAGVPLNTDDHPRVMYINPGFSAAKDFTAYGRLEYLMEKCGHDPRDFAGNGNDSAASAYREDVAAVLNGRDLYLRGAIAEAKGKEAEAVDLYLRSARASGNFFVGYARCLLKAMENGQENPEWAKNLLTELVAARPEIEDARSLLREMFGG